MPTILSVFDLEASKFGSMEEYALFLSQALRARGWKNVLAFSRSVKAEILGLLNEAGATVEIMPRGGQPECYRQLFSILKQWRADIVHYHFLEQHSLLPILGWLSRSRIQIFTDHFRQPQQIGWVTRAGCFFWNRVIFRALGIEILAISQHVKKTLVDCYGARPDHIRVLLNGINVERFKPASSALRTEVRAELGVPESASVVVCASNLRPEKGIGDLIAAAEIVTTERPDTSFVIVGAGPESEHLKNMVEARRLGRSVMFTGGRSDVHRITAAADVIAMPSVWQEPAGLVAIEGMAVGRPVVATQVGGVPEYLEDGVTGVLVKPHAPSELAAALLRLLRAPAESDAMGRKGRARVESRFSMERWVRDTLQLYERALDRK